MKTPQTAEAMMRTLKAMSVAERGRGFLAYWGLLRLKTKAKTIRMGRVW